MKSKITGRFIRKYIVTGAVFTLLVIGLAVGAVILCHTRIWYGDDPTYIFLKQVADRHWFCGHWMDYYSMFFYGEMDWIYW